MKCNIARQLILLALDEHLPQNEANALTRHLEKCDSCRDYSASIGRQFSKYTGQVQKSGHISLSTGFEQRLHERLLVEVGCQESTPVANLDRIYRRVIDLFIPTAIRKPAGVIAALIAIAIAFGGLNAVMHHPLPSSSPQYAFGHLPSFSISTLPDGRVCASVHSSILVPRPLQVRTEQ